jgi:hypothetical protein
MRTGLPAPSDCVDQEVGDGLDEPGRVCVDHEAAGRNPDLELGARLLLPEGLRQFRDKVCQVQRLAPEGELAFDQA